MSDTLTLTLTSLFTTFFADDKRPSHYKDMITDPDQIGEGGGRDDIVNTDASDADDDSNDDDEKDIRITDPDDIGEE
jgi:hypothetical protein